MKNKIFVIRFWPDYEEVPDIICATVTRADAEEMVLSLWQNSGYETYLQDVNSEFFNFSDFSFDFYQDKHYTYEFDFVETKII